MTIVRKRLDGLLGCSKPAVVSQRLVESCCCDMWGEQKSVRGFMGGVYEHGGSILADIGSVVNGRIGRLSLM